MINIRKIITMSTTVLTLTNKEEVLDSNDSNDLCNRIIMCYGSDRPIDNKYWSDIHNNSSQCRYEMKLSCAVSCTSHNIKTITNTTASTSNLKDIQDDDYLITMLEALCGRRRQSIIHLCQREA